MRIYATGTVNAMGRAEDAVERFSSGLNCSQAVLGAFAEEYGLDVELALKVACGFGGGMGRTGGACGAVTGAVMVLGLAQTGPEPREPAAKVRVYGLVQSFLEQFAERHGATECRELLGCDIGTVEGYQQAAGRGLFQSQCPQYVRDAAEILEEML